MVLFLRILHNRIIHTMRFPIYAFTSIVAASTFRLGNATLNTSSAFITPSGITSSTTGNSNGATTSSSSFSTTSQMFDPDYPGTAVERLRNVHQRVQQLATDPARPLHGPWETVRRHILWAGGLRDLTNVAPGQGYTGHSFNDFNHVDLTCMRDESSDNENDGSVQGIALGNRLGTGIRTASLPEVGPGGSWSTCQLGSGREPPQDVAHIQFQSRIAFKLVWAPVPQWDQFVLVDDDGSLLAKGSPTSGLPSLRERQANYEVVKGSKYAREADALARLVAVEE